VEIKNIYENIEIENGKTKQDNSEIINDLKNKQIKKDNKIEEANNQIKNLKKEN
jgi:hypothetical protein